MSISITGVNKIEDILEIEELLEHYQLPNVKTISQNGDTIFHVVVKNKKFSSKKKIKILQILLDQGVDLNTKNNDNETALHLAMKNRARDVIELLFRFKRAHEINWQHSIIMCLIESERDKLLELEKIPDISYIEIQEYESESVSFVEWIMSKGLKICTFEGSTLSWAINFNLLHILPILLKYTMVIDEKNKLLHQILHHRKYLRMCRQGTSSKIRYSFYCEQYTMQIVRDLLNKGLLPEDFDATGMSGLHVAIHLRERIDIIKMLIKRSKYINHKNYIGQTEFYMTINSWIYDESNPDYYRKIAGALVDKGADVNESKNSTDKPLIIAVRNRKLHVIEFLSQRNADFSVTSRNGFTLIHVFLDRNRREKSNVEMDITLLDILISKGCNVNAKDTNGLTPLHMATELGYTQIIQKLIEHGANLNCQDNKGCTPLHYITKYIKLELVDLLLKSGAIVSVTDSEGNTPLELAIFNRKSTSLSEILLKYGANLNKEYSTLFKKGRIIEMRDDMPVRIDTIVVKPDDQYLFKHWMKLTAANVKRAGYIHYDEYFRLEVYKKCYPKYPTEIEKLKSNFIDGSVSFGSFLQMNAYKRCAYINNEKLKNIIGNEVELEKNFPEYSILILGKYREAVTKKSLMELAKVVWLELTKIVLPDLCVECIFSFLNNSELFDFVKDHN